MLVDLYYHQVHKFVYCYVVFNYVFTFRMYACIMYNSIVLIHTYWYICIYVRIW